MVRKPSNHPDPQPMLSDDHYGKNEINAIGPPLSPRQPARHATGDGRTDFTLGEAQRFKLISCWLPKP